MASGAASPTRVSRRLFSDQVLETPIQYRTGLTPEKLSTRKRSPNCISAPLLDSDSSDDDFDENPDESLHLSEARPTGGRLGSRIVENSSRAAQRSPASNSPRPDGVASNPRTNLYSSSDEVVLSLLEMQNSRRKSVEEKVQLEIHEYTQRLQAIRIEAERKRMLAAQETLAVDQQWQEQLALLEQENSRALDAHLLRQKQTTDQKHKEADSNLNQIIQRQQEEERQRREAEMRRQEAERRKREEMERLVAAERAAAAAAAAEAERRRAELAAEARRKEEAEQQRKKAELDAKATAAAMAASAATLSTAGSTAQRAQPSAAVSPVKPPVGSAGSVNTDNISYNGRSNLSAMKSLWQQYEQAMQEFEGHERRTAIFKAIHKSCNQITNRREQISSKMAEFKKILDDAKAYAPLAYKYCTALLAVKLVDQCDILITRNSSAAWGVAHTLVPLASDPAHPGLMECVVSYLYHKCPYIVPCYPKKAANESDDDYLVKKLKYKMKEDGVEGDENYFERMAGHAYLYSAIVSVPPPTGRPHPHGISEAWTWLARILNMPPKRVTAFVLLAFLTHAGHFLQRHYGAQFRKVIDYMETQFLPRVPADTPIDRASRERLKMFITECKSAPIPLPAEFTPSN